MFCVCDVIINCSHNVITQHCYNKVYSTLGHGSKARIDFMAEFDKNSKGKHLGWVSNFEEKITNIKRQNESAVDKTVYAAKLLSDHGFIAQTMTPDEMGPIIGQIIKDSEEKFQYKVVVEVIVLKCFGVGV